MSPSRHEPPRYTPEGVGGEPPRGRVPAERHERERASSAADVPADVPADMPADMAAEMPASEPVDVVPPRRRSTDLADPLHDALATLEIGLAVVDAQWTLTYVNDALAQLIGWPSSEIAGRALGEVFPAMRGGVEHARVRRTMDDGAPRSFRVAHELRGGVFEVRVARSAGRQLVLEVRDATTVARLEHEELRREMALAEASGENALLRELAGRLAQIPDSGTLLSMLCDIVRRECGAAGAGVTAVQGEEIAVLASNGTGMLPAGSVVPLPGSLTAEVVATRRLHRRSQYSSPFAPLQRVVERDRVGEKMIAPLVAYDQVVGVLIATRLRGEEPFSERDERRLRLVADHAALALWKSRLLEQAQAANEAKSTFLATMSHELRTPLTALTGYGELLADEAIVGPLNDAQGEMVERMCSVTHHLSTLIDELLTFSSLEAGREAVRDEEVSSEDLLRAAVAVVEPVARQKGLAVRVLVPPDAPTVRTDPDKVRQILVNLAGNAVKFTERGSVTLSLTTDHGMVRFGVRDTGIGIPASARPRLFQPFTQVESGLTRRYGGSGLGLYISSRLAGLLDGRIELESTPGEGSLFELILPVSRRA